MYSERRKQLPADSLRTIPYVGERYEANLAARGIHTTADLLTYLAQLRMADAADLLRPVFTKADGRLDLRAYNSTLLYAYDRGVGTLPPCIPEA